jgi:hypothetical protein
VLGVPYTEAIRARVERLCISSELLVASRVPAGDGLVADAQRRLAQPDAQWSDAAVQERGRRAVEELGVEGRIGYWIGRALALFRRRGSQRAA